MDRGRYSQGGWSQVPGPRDLTWTSDDPGKGSIHFTKGSRWEGMTGIPHELRYLGARHKGKGVYLDKDGLMNVEKMRFPRKSRRRP